MIIEDFQNLSVLHVTTYGNFNKYLKKSSMSGVGNVRVKELVLAFQGFSLSG